jgi:hypothetical protein
MRNTSVVSILFFCIYCGVKKTENTLGLKKINYALFRSIRSQYEASPARKIRITVGAPVSGRAGVSCGRTTPVAIVGRVGFGVIVTPVDTITALGFGGALSTTGDGNIGAINSRIESTPALIVISVVESADVIVITYDEPEVSVPAVLMTAVDIPTVEPVIDDILTLSFVAWSMIRTRIESIRIDWLNINVIDFGSVATTVSSNRGFVVRDALGVIGRIPEPVLIPVSAYTVGMSPTSKVAMMATRGNRDMN